MSRFHFIYRMKPFVERRLREEFGASFGEIDQLPEAKREGPEVVLDLRYVDHAYAFFVEAYLLGIQQGRSN